ncbi:hypothetical protein HMSSN036_90830 [Paenibacillus macerans]|nr:hypothetical protein HMSSN036_90830 [Paenibacillus macerans]
MIGSTSPAEFQNITKYFGVYTNSRPYCSKVTWSGTHFRLTKVPAPVEVTSVSFPITP